MNILIVDEDDKDRRLLRSTLERHGCMVIEAIDGLEGLNHAIHHQPDIIISNTLMPRMDGFQLLWALKSDPKLTSIPFLFYSGAYTGEQETKLALSLGAAAFIVKQHDPDIIWEQTSAIALSKKPDRNVKVYPAIDKSDSKCLWEYSRIIATKLEEKVRELEKTLKLRRRDAGKLRSLNAELRQEIFEHQKAEEANKAQEQEIASIFEVAPFLMLLIDRNRKIRRANTFACVFTGVSITDIIGRRGGEALRCLHALDSPEGCGFGLHCQQCPVRVTVLNTFDTGQSHYGVEANLPLFINDHEKTVSFLLSTTRVASGNQDMVLLSIHDITEQKAIKLRLQHAQGMESLALLGVGMAHEFNDLLTSIMGYGDITLLRMSASDPNRANVEQILNAAQKSAHLTHELLLYNKTHAAEKKRIDLNESIRSMQADLMRVLGQHIVFATELCQQPLPVFANIHQIELLIVQLAIYARDAMPQGGSLTISTTKVNIDNTFITQHGFGCRGEYALLTTTDSSCDMDTKTHHHTNENPFPTEKISPGAAPGLIVANCIIQQSEGFIDTARGSGKGNTIQTYFPLMTSGAKTTEKLELKQPDRGKETILLAEDDESVRNMAVALLQHFGYDVIVAIDGEDAVQKYLEHNKKIHLLLFDLVMPKKSGKEASDEIRKQNPTIKVLFASGHIPEITKQKKMADENVAFVFKPYLPSVFLQKVRNILDEIKT